MDRKALIDALRRERQHVIDQYGAAGAARVALIDAELARFDERPKAARRERAVPERR
jgi:hypothetical protein